MFAIEGLFLKIPCNYVFSGDHSGDLAHFLQFSGRLAEFF